MVHKPVAARKRVVWVGPQLFAEPRSGGDLRSLRLLAALSAVADVHVVVVGPCDDAERLERELALGGLAVFARDASPARKRWWALRHGWPLVAARSWNPSAAAHVAALRLDSAVTVVDHVRMRPYALHGAVVVSTQNAEGLLMRTLAETQPTAVRRLEQRWDAGRMLRTEQVWTSAPAALVVVSAADARALGRPDAHVVPNGADLPAQATPRPGAGSVLCVGSLDYAPNREAARWWAEEVARVPSIDLPPLTLVGRGGRAALGPLAGHPALEVVGEVPDVAPWLSQARVVAVPLQHGGGTRLKVLEALAWQRPVVATSKAVEGLPVVDGEHLLIADTPADFAAATRRLLDDDSLAGYLVSRGLAVAEQLAWPRLGAQFADIVLGAAA